MKVKRLEVEKRIKKIIINKLKSRITEEDIIPSTNILTDLQFNSVLFVEFIVNLEEEFNIKIENEDLNVNQFFTFEIFIDYLMDKYKL